MRPAPASGDQDLPWAALLRSEMDSWVPDRLPMHFQPRHHRTRPGARRILRPLAVAAAMVLAGTVVYALLPSRPALPSVIDVLGSHFAATPPPTEAPSAKPSTSHHGTPPGREATPRAGAAQPSASTAPLPKRPADTERPPTASPTAAPLPTPTISPSGPLPTPSSPVRPRLS